MSRKEVCKWFNVCPLKRSYKNGKLNKKWVERYCWGDYSSCVRYQMEEIGQYHPDHMLPNGTLDSRNFADMDRNLVAVGIPKKLFHLFINEY